MRYAIALVLVLGQEPPSPSVATPGEPAGFGAQDDPTYTVRFQVGGTS